MKKSVFNNRGYMQKTCFIVPSIEIFNTYFFFGAVYNSADEVTTS